MSSESQSLVPEAEESRDSLPYEVVKPRHGIPEFVYHGNGSPTISEAVDVYQNNVGNSFIGFGTKKQSQGVTQRFECNRKRVNRTASSRSKQRTFFDGKAIGCPVVLNAYIYTDVDGVYIYKRGEHNHESNHSFSRIPKYVKRTELAPSLQGNETPTSYKKKQSSLCDFNHPDPIRRLASLVQYNVPRSDLPTDGDLYRIKAALTRATYQLHSEEDASVNLWIDKLGAERVLLRRAKVVNSIGCRVTPFQLGLITRLTIILLESHDGSVPKLINAPISIDATYKCTKDPTMLLYTIVARDAWGHGIPLSHLLTDSKESYIIEHWLLALQHRFPEWRPSCILTDVAAEQILAIKHCFQSVPMRLCTWHVMEAWRREFGFMRVRKDGTEDEYSFMRHPTLEKLYHLLHEQDVTRFESQRSILQREIDEQLVAGGTVELRHAEYLKRYYISDDSSHPPCEWAHCYRVEKDPVREMNTTMLSESYHNVLKNTIFGRRRNNRMDYVIHALVEISTEYYGWKLREEGLNRDTTSYYHRTKKERHNLARLRSAGISDTTIEWLLEDRCVVPSHKVGIVYHVQLPARNKSTSTYSCTCEDFLRFSKRGSHACKHIQAALRARANGLQDAQERLLADIDDAAPIEDESDNEDDWLLADCTPSVVAGDMPLVKSEVTPAPAEAPLDIQDFPNRLLAEGYSLPEVCKIVSISGLLNEDQLIVSLISDGNKRLRLADSETSKIMRPRIARKVKR